MQGVHNPVSGDFNETQLCNCKSMLNRVRAKITGNYFLLEEMRLFSSEDMTFSWVSHGGF